MTLGTRARKRVDDLIELSGAPHEQASVKTVEGDPCTGAYGFPDPHGVRLALGLDRVGLSVLDRVLRGLVGLLGDEDPVHGGGRLQP
ncbi:MAG: hypothetical protein WD380_05870, partial [Gaiellaceae bacterium]